MNDLLPFVVIGIATGAVYGLAALGLVLTYKTSGIFNFAHGAIAAVSAYAYYQMHVLWGWSSLLSLVIAVIALPPVIAVTMERIARGLAGGTATAKIVATVGLQLAITSALMAHFGAATLIFPAVLPTTSVAVLGVNVGMDQLISLVVAVAGAAGMFLFFRVSPLGVRMRAVVDDPELLGLAGTNAFAVRSWAWLIGSWFAAITGILLAPQLGLDALLLTLLVVQAYGAAAVGLFSSLPLTFLGGLLVGVLAAVSTTFASASEILRGLPISVPFLVLFAVLLIVPRRKLVQAGDRRSAPPGKPLVSSRGALLLAGATVVVALFVPMMVGAKLPVYSQALVFVLILGSLHLLVRVSGQVSLAHAGLVAVGAATFSHLSAGAGLPWLVAVLFGGLVAFPVGALVAIPAIRLSGLYLALATFGFGLLLERLVYQTDVMFGNNDSLPGPRPSGFVSDTAFYYVLLAFAVAGSVAIAAITRARLGRLLRALAESPTSLSTLGLGVNVTRVTVFGLSALLAGIGGALFAAQGQSVSGVPFTAYTSLMWLAVLALNAPARSAAPVLAAIGLAIIPAYINNETITQWLPVLFGIGALAVAMHESSPRGAGVRDAAHADMAEGTRQVLRAAGASPVRQRWLEAAARTTRLVAPSSRPTVVLKGRSR